MATLPDKLDSNNHDTGTLRDYLTMPDYLNNQETWDTVCRIISKTRIIKIKNKKIKNKVTVKFILPYGEREPPDVLQDAVCRIYEGRREIVHVANMHPELSLEEMRRKSENRSMWKALLDEPADSEKPGYRLPWYAIKDIQGGIIIWKEVPNNEHQNYLISVIDSIAGHEAKPLAEYHRDHTPYDELHVIQDADNPVFIQVADGLSDEPKFDPRGESENPEDPESPDFDKMDEEHEESKSETVQKQKLEKNKNTKKNQKWWSLISDAYRFGGDILKTLIADKEKREHDSKLRAMIMEMKDGLSQPYKDFFEEIFKICQADLEFDDDEFNGHLPHGTETRIAKNLGISKSTVTRRLEDLREVYDEFRKNRSPTTSRGDSE